MNYKSYLSTRYPGQFLVSILCIIAIAGMCFVLKDWLGYKVVALLLLVTVSILATILDILPLLLAAFLSALIWNFFFIPPLLSFHIDNAEDLLMFLMYFFISLVNAILTYRIRKQENKARDKEEKEKAIALYNTVLTSLSHELRTPIATIMGAVDTLKENFVNLSEVNKTKLLDEITLASKRLNRQVENLLNISRLESGTITLNLDWCDINELIWTVIQKFEDQEDHCIRFIPGEIHPLYKLDIGLIEQVIHNLVHNAIQHTPPQTLVIIRSYHENGYCMIEISDTGGGIGEQDKSNVFQKFFRGQRAGAGGIGLGLSIVHGIVAAHNGTVTFGNNSNGGVTFTVAIPAETSYLNYLKNE